MQSVIQVGDSTSHDGKVITGANRSQVIGARWRSMLTSDVRARMIA